MNLEQRRERVLRVMMEVLEEGLDTDYHRVSSEKHGLVASDFKMTRSDFLQMQNDNAFADLFHRFCQYISRDLENDSGQ